MNRYIVVDAMSQRVCQRNNKPLYFDTEQQAQDYIDYLNDRYGVGEPLVIEVA